MPQQTGRISDHRQKAMSGDGRKSSSRFDDEAKMRSNSVMPLNLTEINTYE